MCSSDLLVAEIHCQSVVNRTFLPWADQAGIRGLSWARAGNLGQVGNQVQAFSWDRVVDPAGIPFLEEVDRVGIQALVVVGLAGNFGLADLEGIHYSWAVSQELVPEPHLEAT